jgi:hypothetical protein
MCERLDFSTGEGIYRTGFGPLVSDPPSKLWSLTSGARQVSDLPVASLEK